MANILYGVNGEGSGHSTRAKEVLRHLSRQGHSLHVASFDRGLKNLSDEFEVTEIHGLRLAYVNNRVRYGKTAAKNLLSAPKAAKSHRGLMQSAETWKIDLVITDFEPMTCHVAHRRKLPLIAIDNQHAITNCDVSYPKEYRKDAAATRVVTRLMTPRANANLVISFFPAEVKKKNTFVFPPLLRQEVLSARPTTGDFVLVYVTSPSPHLAEILARVHCNFVAYGFGREGAQGNVLYKKASLDGFLADLTNCKAVIANAGFSLISEALYLGKPYFAIPVAHQFEQIFNAYYLDKLGYGAYWKELSKEKIESFLFNLDWYREKLAEYPRSDNSALLAKLDGLISAFSNSRALAAAR
ncbi:MAG TPA: MJ1255/VC2487 family glycosyltransferase [Terriglobales bacterium]|nr:MJ1255/VC2487 family glycosyltransferase [Terriglobales bacterium]